MVNKIVKDIIDKVYENKDMGSKNLTVSDLQNGIEITIGVIITKFKKKYTSQSIVRSIEEEFGIYGEKTE